ncbi:hypothetical protein PR202_ga29867 [Eleusine coracana subsp. coracana]|uniref:Reverse transcriptase zinc-binding domain-containing protein n=1 Tax=Eleusine coracana subsp. coracana TaxID=191504 RepID=A0AAV5DN09_ELECO|nr:hypothetical protein PR202_ga29867 [Eleusine coracana subsp. coracana]
MHINFGKSTVVPMHVGNDVVQECVGLLGCRQEGFSHTYLGLPLSNEKLNMAAMAPLFRRSDRYLAGWQPALLIHKSRTVLINAVLDALPTYLMSALQLPLGAIDKYDEQRRAFLWSGEDTVSGAQCLVAWDVVTGPLEKGGLRVRDIAVQNNCMLLKLIHRMFTAMDSSWVRWVRSRADLSNLTGDMEGTHWPGLRQLLPIYQSITSTAALYRLVLSVTSLDYNFYKFVWKRRAPQRIRFFGWLMVQGRIQCKTNLLKNIVDDDNCDVCGATGENTDHIMFGCSFTRSFWTAIGVGLPPNPSMSRPCELQWPSSIPTKHWDTLAVLCYWQVWKHRNKVIFRKEPPSLA